MMKEIAFFAFVKSLLSERFGKGCLIKSLRSFIGAKCILSLLELPYHFAEFFLKRLKVKSDYFFYFLPYFFQSFVLLKILKEAKTVFHCLYALFFFVH